jgi:hypothetical protein
VKGADPLKELMAQQSKAHSREVSRMPIRGEMKYDKRIIDRNIRVGLVTKKEYKGHLNKLKDLDSETEKVESEVHRIQHEIPSAPVTDEDEL